MKIKKEEKRKRKHLKVRRKVKGNWERLRLVVFRSQKHIYASFVNDDETPCKVLATVSTLSEGFKKYSEGKDIKTWTKDAAGIVGQLVAEKAKEIGIEKITFDRGGYKYTGRLKVLAESARKGGLKF